MLGLRLLPRYGTPKPPKIAPRGVLDRLGTLLFASCFLVSILDHFELALELFVWGEVTPNSDCVVAFVLFWCVCIRSRAHVCLRMVTGAFGGLKAVI